MPGGLNWRKKERALATALVKQSELRERRLSRPLGFRSPLPSPFLSLVLTAARSPGTRVSVQKRTTQATATAAQ